MDDGLPLTLSRRPAPRRRTARAGPGVSAIRVERVNDLALVRLDKARGNAIDESLTRELRDAAAALAGDAAVRGMLLCSGHPKLFCPGLDLVDLSGRDRPEMERFLALFHETVAALYGFPKPVVAALSGAAVAGGCVLALTADLRVLRRGAPIGLNEVKVGLPLPWPVATLLAATVAPPALTRVALLGNNFENEQAVAAGLVHEIAEADGFEATCVARLRELVERDAAAVAATKRYLRAPVLAAMREREQELAHEFLDAWFSPATRARVGEIVDSLSKRGGGERA